MPFNQNINITQLVAAIAMLLTMFGINLDPHTQAAIVSIILGVSVVVTWVLHTFVNHPANKAAAAKLVDKAVSAAKRSSPLLAIVFVLVLLGLSACATMTPAAALDAATAGVATVEAGYAAVCQADTTVAICTPAAQLQVKNLEKVLNDTITVAQVAIATLNGGPTTDAVTADIQAVVKAVADLQNFVADMQSKAAAKGIHFPVTVHRR